LNFTQLQVWIFRLWFGVPLRILTFKVFVLDFDILCTVLAKRTKELAIRASVGAGYAQISTALLKEILKALGAGLAIGFAAIVIGEKAILGNAAFIKPPGPAFRICAMVMVACVTMSAVLMPTLRALRMNLAKELRVD
jgi:ABC-type antimicrobial peptide transport system permease subunit